MESMLKSAGLYVVPTSGNGEYSLGLVKLISIPYA